MSSRLHGRTRETRMEQSLQRLDGLERSDSAKDFSAKVPVILTDAISRAISFKINIGRTAGIHASVVRYTARSA